MYHNKTFEGKSISEERPIDLGLGWDSVEWELVAQLVSSVVDWSPVRPRSRGGLNLQKHHDPHPSTVLHLPEGSNPHKLKTKHFPLQLGLQTCAFRPCVDFLT